MKSKILIIYFDSFSDINLCCIIILVRIIIGFEMKSFLDTVVPKAVFKKGGLWIVS